MADKNWVQKATSNAHGQFRKKAQEHGESTAEYARQEEHAPGKLGKEARLAENLMGLNHKRKKKPSHARRMYPDMKQEHED